MRSKDHLVCYSPTPSNSLARDAGGIVSISAGKDEQIHNNARRTLSYLTGSSTEVARSLMSPPRPPAQEQHSSTPVSASRKRSASEIHAQSGSGYRRRFNYSGSSPTTHRGCSSPVARHNGGPSSPVARGGTSSATGRDGDGYSSPSHSGVGQDLADTMILQEQSQNSFNSFSCSPFTDTMDYKEVYAAYNQEGDEE